LKFEEKKIDLQFHLSFGLKVKWSVHIVNYFTKTNVGIVVLYDFPSISDVVVD